MGSGRPRKDEEHKLEKALTHSICKHISLSSGLNYVELEVVFKIGAVNHAGKPTGRTMSRYCDESRACDRETLKRMVAISIERNWINHAQVNAWQLDKTLLFYQNGRTNELFAARKAERDKVAKQLRLLRETVRQTEDLIFNKNLKYVVLAQQTPSNSSENNTYRSGVNDLDRFLNEAGADAEHITIRPSNSLLDALKILEMHLEDTVLTLTGRGLGFFEDSSKPKINLDHLNKTSTFVPSHSQKISLEGIDMSDIDDLLNTAEKWCKSGAPVTINVQN